LSATSNLGGETSFNDSETSDLLSWTNLVKLTFTTRRTDYDRDCKRTNCPPSFRALSRSLNSKIFFRALYIFMELNLTNESSLVFRIIFESRENYRVMNSEQVVFPAEMAGRVRGGSLWPAVGDWVRGLPQAGGWIQIVEVMERRSVLSRRSSQGGDQILAANVDTLFIVTSANEDLNLNRLDRYIALARSGGVRPVILINKIELSESPRTVLDLVASRFADIDVIGLSVYEGWNLECLNSYAEADQTVAFVGSSGVGKSSLTNYLLGTHSIAVQEIRESDGRGRHTTTHRELHVAPSGAVVIDTPGIRLVGLSDETDLSATFADIERLAANCKFGDCAHQSEPGCAVKEALANGGLDLGRWNSYLKLGRELKHERRKSNKALQAEEKKKWVKLHTDHRARKRLKP
jgi:ribosome biogenesis GTPase / thiamine phosphate phosphatase